MHVQYGTCTAATVLKITVIFLPYYSLNLASPEWVRVSQIYGLPSYQLPCLALPAFLFIVWVVSKKQSNRIELNWIELNLIVHDWLHTHTHSECLFVRSCSALTNYLRDWLTTVLHEYSTVLYNRSSKVTRGVFGLYFILHKYVLHIMMYVYGTIVYIHTYTTYYYRGRFFILGVGSAGSESSQSVESVSQFRVGRAWRCTGLDY